ncbi:dTDP-4-amino-4,6-dideoxygalactose transaminase [Thermomonospora echinospora]|uniref:dTDP-4-amino-4,6-dideoxygalactose transaminase n=1 Tax=Thermomonospora echinospora TaxID=1992 RepID=A0A1H5TX98_9ACTN|nr:DegT/DnrJ/EryC1/StrS family aminotransferase [Thermomonospora echinospora]SEF66647.1 dTDP-4-amino-4,6-dideoxygalactose transaminase [Thermomonospora echinospora]
MINVFQPSLGEEELEAIREVFARNWLGYGPRTQAFETEFAAHLQVERDGVLFVNSCTSGLFMAMELLELGPGDDVVLPSVNFIANANAVAVTGAWPVFCDVDSRTLNPTVTDVERALTPRTKAVVVLHYGGHPGEIEGIAALCRERGVALVEDAACSIASSVNGTMCGTFGDIGVWSLDARKIITTGDGGVLRVRDPELARRAHRLAYHGMVDRSSFTAMADLRRRWWELAVQEIGRRSIGNDVTAAIGSVQLRRLAGFVARRRAIAETYDRLLAEVEGVRTPPPLPDGHVGSYYFYWVQLDAAIRDQVAEDLLDCGIYTTFRYPPLHRTSLYRSEARLPRTDEAAETTLLLPIHQGLTDEDVETVVGQLAKVVGNRGGGRVRR